MCGIFGLITQKQSNYDSTLLESSFSTLAHLSENRGKDSSGLCLLSPDHKSFNVLKGSISISRLMKNKKVSNIISSNLKNEKKNIKFLFGHARLVTNGTQLNEQNNQPVIKDDIIAVHNGIITNTETLWRKNSDLVKEYEIDTEIILSLFRKFMDQGFNINDTLSKIYKKIEGSASIALVPKELNKIILATNTGSIYTLSNNKDFFIFASELQIVKSLNKILNKKIPGLIMSNTKAGNAIIIDYGNFKIEKCKYNENSPSFLFDNKRNDRDIILQSIKSSEVQRPIINDLNFMHLNPKAKNEKLKLIYPLEKIDQLIRCSRCILPETFPFIYFDHKGICNYCNNYFKKEIDNSLKSLNKLVEPYRKKNKPDVLLPISGGRDSIYTLHLVKNELGMNPITYTYDWGMVTDLARRNIARITGELGVENIIVAADIHWKRKNIKKNILAWLKKPALGMIPLFMAGDKYFYYYAYKVKKELGIDLEIWGINNLENTNFKTGFCGVKPNHRKKWNYSLSFSNQIQLMRYYSFNYLRNPSYINQSMIDTLGSYLSRYVTPKTNHIQLFDYYKWNEKELEKTIINKYGWEICVDTTSTWRIGDGTASFYNYIYGYIAGFTENDTFRSNQIREGMITRETALKLVREENYPRYNSLKWYLEILGLNFDETINRINSFPKLY